MLLARYHTPSRFITTQPFGHFGASDGCFAHLRTGRAFIIYNAYYILLCVRGVIFVICIAWFTFVRSLHCGHIFPALCVARMACVRACVYVFRGMVCVRGCRFVLSCGGGVHCMLRVVFHLAGCNKCGGERGEERGEPDPNPTHGRRSDIGQGPGMLSC